MILFGFRKIGNIHYDDLKKIENIVNAIEQYNVELKEGDSIKFSITITSGEHLNSLNKYSAQTEPIQMKIEAPSDNLNLFGEEIMIPQIRQMFTHIKAQEINNYDSKKMGDSIEFEYIAEKILFIQLNL